MNIRYSLIALALLVGASFATDPRFEQGARFLAQGEYEKALGEYRAVLAEQPQNSDAYFAAAEVYIKMPKPDYSRALANYRLAYKFTPTMSAAYEGAAKVYEKLGQKAKAEAELAKDPKNRPVEETAPAATEPVAETAAPAAAAPEQPAPAQAAPAQEPAPAQPAQAAATPAPAQAAPAETAAAPVAPTPAAQAPAPAATPQATPAASAATANPDDPFEKGKAFLAEGKFEDAAKMWRDVLKKTPGHVGAYYYAGVTRLKMGEYDKAEFNLKKGQDYKEAGADVHYYLAQVYKAQNKTDLEKKSLAAYVKKSGPKGEFRKDVEARLAELKNATADTATAATATAAAPAQDAATADVATAEDAKAAPKIAPAPAKAYSIARANDLFKAGSFEEALQVYKVMLETEISPDERYFALLQMGNIYRELRDFHSAASRYREVVQQYPDSDWATEAERALEDAVWLENHASELPRRMR